MQLDLQYRYQLKPEFDSSNFPFSLSTTEWFIKAFYFSWLLGLLQNKEHLWGEPDCQAIFPLFLISLFSEHGKRANGRKLSHLNLVVRDRRKKTQTNRNSGWKRKQMYKTLIKKSRNRGKNSKQDKIGHFNNISMSFYKDR